MSPNSKPSKMKICLILKIIVCGLLFVFPVDIKGQTCQCTIGVECVTCRHDICTNKVCTYGCAVGYYHYAEDDNCRRCPNECFMCNSNSDCTFCIAGRTGSSCQNCKYGHYLKQGQCIQCNTNCLQNKCFHKTGGCTVGCKSGWSGLRCNYACATTCDSCERSDALTCISCSLDHYGTSCESECSSNCVTRDGTRQCNVHNGDCNYGCVDGWTGLKCTDKCDMNCISCDAQDKHICHTCRPGFYGQSCDNECSSNCATTDDVRQCSKIYGDCNFGCVDGWTGSKCIEKCDMNCISCDAQDKHICHTCRPRCYGKSCENQCSLNCVKTVDIRKCRKSDGQCTDGCVEGWTGSMCTEQCAANCTSCNRWNETACTSCKPGYYGPSCYIECSGYCGDMSNASKLCQQNDGTCLDDCVTGYKGDKCDVPCDAGCRSDCDRDTGVCQPCRRAYFGPLCQHLCNATCYDPGNGSNVCHQLSGECLFDCSQFLCSPDGGTQDAQTSVNVAVIGGAVGSAVMIVLVVAAVLVFMFLRKKRRKMSDPERRVTYDNSVNIEDDNVYSVPDKKKSVYKNVDKTQSTAHSTLPKLPPSNRLITHVDVIYDNVGGVRVIPSRLCVDEPEDNVEELCEDVAKSGDRKAHYTNVSPSLGPVLNREDHYTALTPSLGPVYEELDKNDDVGYGHIKV